MSLTRATIGETEHTQIRRPDQNAQSEPVQGGFLSFSIVGLRNVWAIGTEGEFLGKHASVALRSTDGGESWVRKLARTDDHFFAIYFLDDQVGWVAGASGTLLRSTDGGEHWERQRVPTESNLNKIQFINPQYGWVSGFDGELLRTEDGGRSWRSHRLKESSWVGDQFKGFITSLDFSDKDHGWIVGEHAQAYRSTDGGVNWQSQGAAFAKLIPNSAALRVVFEDVKFLTPSFGIIVAQISKENSGDGKKILLFQTRSGGDSWTVLESFKEPGFVRAQFLGETEFWIEANYGRSLLHTRDGGKSWTRSVLPDVVVSPLMYFLDPNVGWMMSSLDGFSGFNLQTTDAGKTWSKLRVQYSAEQATR